jgi:hypothetical protein
MLKRSTTSIWPTRPRISASGVGSEFRLLAPPPHSAHVAPMRLTAPALARPTDRAECCSALWAFDSDRLDHYTIQQVSYKL